MVKHKTKGKTIVALLLAAVMMLSGCITSFATITDENQTAVPSYITNSTEKALWMDACPVSGTSEIDAVKWFLDSDGIYYMLLPTSADLSNITVYHTFTDARIGQTQIISGNAYDIFEDGGDYTLDADGETYRIKVLQSSQIGSMFITTESGSMDNIHADKENKEAGSLLLIDTDGTVSYDGEMDQIKGRGNTTWNLAKKPYNIKLGKKAELMGMAKSKKWTLLANAQEHSGLRNRLTYDLADQIGLEFSPESRFVDLYANGEYLGTYQLTEKVDLGEDNLVKITDLQSKTEDLNDQDLDAYSRYTNGRKQGYNIPNNPEDITGGYLMEYVWSVGEPSGFTTNGGQALDLKSPEFASKEQIEYIASFVQDMEDAVYSSTGYNAKGKHYTDYIDAESAALMYIVQEFALNQDAAISSLFAYKESDIDGDGKIHFSPVWDFDIAYGNLNATQNGHSMLDYTTMFVADSRMFYESDRYTILGALCQHTDFNTLVTELWKERVVPAIQIWNGEKEATARLQSFDTYKQLTDDTSVMNYIRWDLSSTLLVWQAGDTHEKQLAYFKTWADNRYDFLNGVFSTLEDVKAQASEELLRYYNSYNSADYSETDWNNITKAKDDGLRAIENADTAAAVTKAKDDAISQMKAIAGVMVYYDNNQTNWEEVRVFWWNSPSSPCEWPGELMTDLGEGIYSFKFPSDTNYIIFTNGLPSGIEKEQTEDLLLQEGLQLFVPDIDSKYYKETIQGYCYNGDWAAYDPTPEPTEPPTSDPGTESTEPPTEPPTEDPDYKQGDANLDKEVNLEDVLTMQRHIAKTIQLTGVAVDNADINFDKTINLEDVLILQKFLAKMLPSLPAA